MSDERIVSVTGWLTLIGIIAFEVIGPGLLAGTPVAGSTDRATIEAFYRHDLLVPLGLATMALMFGFVPFVAAIRTVLNVGRSSTFWVDAGFGFALVAAALLLVRSAWQMALVRSLAGGSDILPTFFAWDFVYNGAVYAMEAGYVVAFSVAIGAWAATPRWFQVLAGVTAVLQLVGMMSSVVGIPNTATIPGNILFAGWFASVTWLVGHRRPVTAIGRRSSEPVVHA